MVANAPAACQNNADLHPGRLSLLTVFLATDQVVSKTDYLTERLNQSFFSLRCPKGQSLRLIQHHCSLIPGQLLLSFIERGGTSCSGT